MALDEIQLVCIDCLWRSTIPLHRLKLFGKRFDFLCNAEDELVVPNIDGAAEQFAALRIRARDYQVLYAHQVPLEARSHESINVLAHRHENLARQMSALLAAVQLVFKVDGRSTILGKEFSQLEYCR